MLAARKELKMANQGFVSLFQSLPFFILNERLVVHSKCVLSEYVRWMCNYARSLQY